MTDANRAAVELVLPGGSMISRIRGPLIEELLFDRATFGGVWQERCRGAASELLEAAIEEGAISTSTAELMLLSKGHAYDLSATSRKLGMPGLPINMIATRRATVTSESALIDVPYHRLDTASSELVIGDTVASGASICRALETYMAIHTLEKVVVLSLAGTYVGGQAIERFCHERSLSVRFYYGLAAFGLSDNGFDISFAHPDTRCSDDNVLERARDIYLGKQISVAGWDFGSQYMSPGKYRNLCWVEAEVWDMHGSELFSAELEPDDWSLLEGERHAFAGTHPHLGR